MDEALTKYTNADPERVGVFYSAEPRWLVKATPEPISPVGFPAARLDRWLKTFEQCQNNDIIPGITAVIVLGSVPNTGYCACKTGDPNDKRLTMIPNEHLLYEPPPKPDKSLAIYNPDTGQA
jgi:hypothetical protein